MAQGLEDVAVEDFGAQRAIEALDERVLGRLAGLDELQADAVPACPQRESLADQLGAVGSCRKTWNVSKPFRQLPKTANFGVVRTLYGVIG